jgi:uncharacterized Zn finger protein
MDALPQLTEDQIRDLAFGASFSRGYIYFERSSIVNPRQMDMTLRAQCWGSAPQPYHVQATLGHDGIQSAFCSCPVGAGGACKHVVALLLTWLHQPQRFKVMASMEESLNQRSKEELVEIILKLVSRDPDLASLLEMPLPGRAVTGQPLESDLIRRQVHAIIDHVPYEWGASYAAAGEVSKIVGDGDDYRDAGDWMNAAVVYRTVMKEILDSFDEIYQEESEYTYEVIACVRGLADCLEQINNAAERSVIVRDLFEVVRWDFNYGGMGLSDDAESVLLEQATSEERAELADWVRSLLKVQLGSDESIYRQYRLQELGGFLLGLERDTLDDEGFIALCRETGRLRDLVGRLLALGRVQEAAKDARNASDDELITLCQDIREAGHVELAERLIWERQEVTRDTRLLQQLLTWVQERGDTDTAVMLASQIFDLRSDLNHYRQLRNLAQAAGRWPEVEAKAIDSLAANNISMMIEVHLEEDRIDEALAGLHTTDKTRTGYSYYPVSVPLRLKVARAAEVKRPEAAIEIYLAEAQRLIDARGRQNYADAARHLKRVRDVLQVVGESERWRALIARIRDENRRLPALKDELNQAGL